jgi:hypothetical protein
MRLAVMGPSNTASLDIEKTNTTTFILCPDNLVFRLEIWRPKLGLIWSIPTKHQQMGRVWQALVSLLPLSQVIIWHTK